MIRTVLSALAALALLGAPALAQSAPPPPAAAPQPAAAPGRAPLSPQVRQTVRDTRQRFAPQVRPIRQDMRDARQALRAELAKPQPSDATLRQLEDRLVADRQRLQAIHAQADAELRARLSPRDYAHVMMKRAARAHGRARRGHRRAP